MTLWLTTRAEARKGEPHMSQDNKKHIKVMLVWGGTGESKPANPELEDTAGSVFEDIYQRFQQQASDQDTFEVNDKDFPRSQFGQRVREVVDAFGQELVFEVIPPTA